MSLSFRAGNPRRTLPLTLCAAVLGCAGADDPSGWSDLFELREPVALQEPITPLLVPSSRIRDVRLDLLRDGRVESGVRPGARGTSAAYALELGNSFGRPRIIDETPYWGQGIPYHRWAVEGPGRTLLATSLYYPIVVRSEDAEPPDSISDPPPSWRAPRPPDPGEFSNVGEGAADRVAAHRRYLEEHTVIIGMALLAVEVLVVSHGHYMPATGDYMWTEPTTMHTRSVNCDVRVRGGRVATDLPCPGEIVAWGGNSVFFWQPPSAGGAEHGSVVEYVWRGGARD
ncbi:MAG: hypothetical protein WEA24_10030 [Gemmatimonadota bacterium]